MKTDNRVTHTPLPWHVSQSGTSVADSTGRIVAHIEVRKRNSMGGDQRRHEDDIKSDAHLIVMAANNYYELLEALKEAELMVRVSLREQAIKDGMPYDEANEWSKNHHKIQMFNKAISKAEGKPE